MLYEPKQDTPEGKVWLWKNEDLVQNQSGNLIDTVAAKCKIVLRQSTSTDEVQASIR